MFVAFCHQENKRSTRVKMLVVMRGCEKREKHEERRAEIVWLVKDYLQNQAETR